MLGNLLKVTHHWDRAQICFTLPLLCRLGTSNYPSLYISFLGVKPGLLLPL